MHKISEICAGAASQFRINLNGGHASGGSDHFSNNGCVVTNTTADMKNLFSRPKVESVKPKGNQTRHSVVQAAFRVNCDEYVLIKMLRIGIRSRSIAFL